MSYLDEQFVKTKEQQELMRKAAVLSERFFKRAEKHDCEASFPFDNFEDLKKEGFYSLTIPKEFGGKGIDLYTFLLLQERIAHGDGPTALSIGWHSGLFINLRESMKWEPAVFEEIARDAAGNNKLINSAASEAGTGSPQRGGKPETTARKTSDGWIINGRKIFTSLAPILDYFIITASLEETDEVAEFIIQRTTPGLSIEETWNTMGMRGTRSDDLILTDVNVPEKALVSGNNEKKQMAQGWLLHIPACYLGIAISARNYAVQFAKHYQPNSLSHPISEVPEVRRKTAEMDLKLYSARQLMYAAAAKWDEDEAVRPSLGAELAAVKHIAVNAAIDTVDLAMRMVGGQSLFKSKPLERLYRDVRAGLHNPPSEDVAIKLMADRAYRE
ncbi:acyl-CoA/acyl-ACP dehydrogenase [Metabacillus sp. GX 13764]|uniref:acyl-CoA dehydrogenase family protein n=1 Tax=Metabacillus kandeliae TaxID=2900151 RepID=UPI001E5DD3CE|nr:acyl-CoA dehydrogenase family protein [Metabacillus kandeliae]MCD7035497.1 acyl-CoA/acyl-ACP dehydrogenase [Metabacillus kandeliae]